MARRYRRSLRRALATLEARTLNFVAFTNRDIGTAAFPAACLLVAAVLILLLLEAREVVAAAMNH